MSTSPRCPVVVVPQSAAVGIDERSRVERQALFHVAGTALWARNGEVVSLPPVLGSLILALAASYGRTLAYGAAIDAIWGDDPDGGPLNPIGLIGAHRSREKDALAVLGSEVDIWRGCGFLLDVHRVVVRGKVRRPLTAANGVEPYWGKRARYMAERGATNDAIARAVGRSGRNVEAILTGGYAERDRGPRTRQTPEGSKRGTLRKMARKEASVTGEHVDFIYARWGCEKVDLSRLWDQRKGSA